MNNERIDHHSGYYADHHDRFGMGATGRHWGAAEGSQAPLVSPDPAWDPAEELAYMLQDALAAEHRSTVPPLPDEMPATIPPPGGPLNTLQDITAELPPLTAVSRGHRKLRERRRVSGVRALSYLIAALAAVITSTVSVFGGMATYEPLRQVALFHTRSDAVSWWPLLFYGPWAVAALSILRAELHRCRAVHSWVVVVLFSAAAVLMCVVHEGGSITDAVAAALPTCASLACFQQLLRQITLTRPHRRTRPRHRLRLSAMTSHVPDAGSVCAMTDRDSRAPLLHRPDL